MMNDIILSKLNESQNASVTSNLHGQLSILAGPGSGKTHTLVARIAWLLSNGTPPWNILVTTFTVKAAREMKVRIGKLVGISKSSKLILGTFHSIARRYLSQYGHLINIKNNFEIADSADSMAIVKRIITTNELNIDSKVVRNHISRLKSKGDNKAQNDIKHTLTSFESQEFKLCYHEYEDTLRRSNLLDYDDLLLNCVKLLREYPLCVANIEAVLIDEFQDTNAVQFDLMRLFASHRQQVTIVGDPDQCIYGFRTAETENYKRFQRQYPDSTTITLEANYRSSGAILLAALTVIRQDGERVAKTLVPIHTFGTRPVLRKLSDAHNEAEWITSEIRRVMGMTGGLLDLNDFSILLRSASLSRLIENNLGKAGIAYRMVGGVRFYDRAEIRVLLDYLRLINQPDNDDALLNIVNKPSRKIGDTTLKKLIQESCRNKITLWSLILRIIQGRKTCNIKITTQAIRGLSDVYDIIQTARDNFSSSQKSISLLDVVKYILDKTKYEEWLKVHFNDILKTRWSNVEELMAQVIEFQSYVTDSYGDESLPSIDGLEQKGELNILTKFLANVALSAGTEQKAGEDQTPRITISTIHAAKGLEWPVVFIPAVYHGSIPHSRSNDVCEERRLLYVAMTRAQALLYLSYPLKDSRENHTKLTKFMSSSSISSVINLAGPVIQSEEVYSISRILHRTTPTIEAIRSSSSLLPSIYDDIISTDCENDKSSVKMPFYSSDGNKNFDQSLRGPKRRCVQLGEEDHFNSVKMKCPILLDKYSRNSMISSTEVGFVSASTHFEKIFENSVGLNEGTLKQTEKSCKKFDELKNRPSNAESSQKSLLRYLVKSGSELKADSTDRKYEESKDDAQYDLQLLSAELSFDSIREPQTCIKLSGDVSHLSNISVQQSSRIPHKISPTMEERQKYALILPNSKDSARVVSVQKNSATVKKTLGVRRSMTGWSSRKDYVSPVVDRKTN